METRKISELERANIGHLSRKCATCQHRSDPCPLIMLLLFLPPPPKEGEPLDIPVASLALWGQIARCEHYRPVWEGISDV